ncbi:hypothetical protein ACIA8K_12585 [Catenuloplanes sp. NPDC051500]|uniref:hypothetical protein n=1 Tax=Catenuloplanes sp. NPDC051500 TaxID=3363959 RepID=UPI0037AD3DAF
MATNPNPTRISGPMWSLWERFVAFHRNVKLGGVYADKPGYHNYRDDLPTDDYSRGDVAADREGNGKLSSAIDLTFPDASDMRLFSKRLHDAMKARDGRLFIDGKPILREYIGTLDSETVSCYVLTGGKALGVGADSGPDAGRDTSHLWHVHISFIRKYADSQDAMDRVLSILKGESYDDWVKGGGKPSTPAPAPAPSGKLAEDGILGAATIKALQKKLGTPETGAVTQGAPSPMIKALQRYLNAKVNAKLAIDGYGFYQNGQVYKTVAALQKYLGTPVTGALTKGAKSTAIVALQKRLNAGTF